MNNNMMGALTGQLSQAIQCAPGIPPFARDEMCQALQSLAQSCPQEPTPPGCRQDTDNAMNGLIDKIVNKVVDQIMQKLQGGGCENGGSIQDMVRQAIEDVVREKFGGEGGGSCPANGDTATAQSGAGGSSSANNSSETEGSTTCPAPMPPTDDSDEAKKARSGNWLVALAQAMSSIAGKHLTNMIKAQGDMERSTPEGDEKQSDEQKAANGRAFTEAQGRFQAESKLFGMVTEATSTALKTIGDGLSSLARKQ
jgi:hypothetical protein